MAGFPTLRDRLRVLRAAWAGEYSFSLHDYWLYLRFAEWPGRRGRFPELKVLDEDSGFVRLRIGGQTYYWPSESERNGLRWMHQEVFAAAGRNPHAYEYRGAAIRPGDLVIDAGACEGFFTRYALRRGATVLALEPVPSLAGAMRKTFAAEIAVGQATVLPCALHSTSGHRKLSVNEDRVYESRCTESGQDVESIRLDDLPERDRVGFVKMDIEGAELDAIRGARETLAARRPRLSIGVYHEFSTAREAVRLLREIQPQYHLVHRGIFADAGCAPRPFMVYAW